LEIKKVGTKVACILLFVILIRQLADQDDLLIQPLSKKAANLSVMS